MVSGARGSSRPPGSPELSIVIPAHNEERRIGPMLSSYAESFAGQSEIIVVLNGCTDRTIDVVRSIRARSPTPIRIVDIPEAIGKGGAVQEGFRRAHGAIIGFVDADNATSAQEFARLLSMLGDADGIIGSRWMKGAQVYQRTSALRRLASLGFTILTRWLFRLQFHDTQCGAKLFRQHVITTLLPKLRVRDMTFDVELLILARAHHFAIREEPTVWVDRSSSVLLGTPGRLLRTSTTMFRSLIRLYMRARREHFL